MRNEFKKLAEQINYRKLVDKYADPEIEDLPDLDEYLDEWEDSGGFDPEFLDATLLEKDIILYASNLSFRRH